MRLTGIALAAVAAAAISTAIAVAEGAQPATPRGSNYCGTLDVPDTQKDARVYAHNVRCKKARRVGKYFLGTGPKVRGWTCSASLGRCYEGDFDSRTYVRFNFHTTHPGQPGRPRASGSSP